MVKIKQAQSILEYAILIAIVIAAVVVMQVYMKRGVSGRLKDSSDKISGGESFSANATTTKQTSKMVGSRDITEMTGTGGKAGDVAGELKYGGTVEDLSAHGSYSASGSTQTGSTVSSSNSRTLEASNEAFQAKDVKSSGTTDTDFSLGDKI